MWSVDNPSRLAGYQCSVFFYIILFNLKTEAIFLIILKSCLNTGSRTRTLLKSNFEFGNNFVYIHRQSTKNILCNTNWGHSEQSKLPCMMTSPQVLEPFFSKWMLIAIVK